MADTQKMPQEESPLVRARRMGVLVLVTAQNCSLIMVASYSRSQSAGPLYLASVAVLATEIVKTIIIFGLLAAENGVRGAWDVIYNGVFSWQTLQFAVPAGLYTIQGNLWFFGVTYLGSVMSALTNQLKVVTTAFFSVVMLKRQVSLAQWGAIFILMSGLSVMQVKLDSHGVDMKPLGLFYYLGLLAMLTACFSSGYAGVYMERILKGRDNNIWISNLQLQVFQIPLTLLAVAADYKANGHGGSIFQGWGPVVWLVVVLDTVGGFAVTFAMKYADNILKTFAVSASLVLNCILSACLMGKHMGLQDVVGVSMVISATWIYNCMGMAAAPPPPPAQEEGLKELGEKLDAEQGLGKGAREMSPLAEQESCSASGSSDSEQESPVRSFIRRLCRDPLAV